MLNVGLIGVGRIGRVHGSNLVRTIPRARLTMIADPNEDSLRVVSRELGVDSVTPDFTEVLANPSIDAVLICGPTDIHADIIIESARFGKHIFCEKPIDHELGRIDAALKAVSDAGVKLQIAFQRRFDPEFARIRQAVRTGEIGDPHLMHIISRDPLPPPIDFIKTSGGLFLDMMIHDLDISRHLMGCEVTEVFAKGAVRVDPAIGEAGDVDTAVVMLTFENGVIATIENSRKAVYGYDQRVEVFGSLGAIKSANVHPNSAIVSTSEGIRRDLPLHFFVERYQDAYRLELTAFVDAILDEEPVPVTGLDGRAPVVLGLAAMKSMKENRPVAVSEITA